MKRNYGHKNVLKRRKVHWLPWEQKKRFCSFEYLFVSMEKFNEGMKSSWKMKENEVLIGDQILSQLISNGARSGLAFHCRALIIWKGWNVILEEKEIHESRKRETFELEWKLFSRKFSFVPCEVGWKFVGRCRIVSFFNLKVKNCFEVVLCGKLNEIVLRKAKNPWGLLLIDSATCWFGWMLVIVFCCFRRHRTASEALDNDAWKLTNQQHTLLQYFAILLNFPPWKSTVSVEHLQGTQISIIHLLYTTESAIWSSQ
jgi:hypothetical protein